MILALMCIVASSRAQDTVAVSQFTRSSYGIAGGIDRNLYRSAFNYLPGYLSCSPLITTGSGFGPNVMTSYSYRPGSNILLSFGAGFRASNGMMAVDEGTSMNLDGV